MTSGETLFLLVAFAATVLVIAGADAFMQWRDGPGKPPRGFLTRGDGVTPGDALRTFWDHRHYGGRAKNPIGDPFGHSTGNFYKPTYGPHN